MIQLAKNIDAGNSDDFDGLLSFDETTNSAGTPLGVARAYIARGWSPVPIKHKEKGPKLPGWGRFRLDHETATIHFGTARQNIGVILGSASGDLVDIDLDTPEARALAPAFLPETPAIFGRASSPASHWLYRAAGLVTEQVKEPGGTKVLLELRSNSNTDQPSQTVFPGSVHQSGELIQWRGGVAGEPASVAPDDLTARVHRLAAATIIARRFPAEGDGRHNATLTLVGFLMRAGWTADDVVGFVRVVRDAVGADSRKPLGKMVKDAAKRLAAEKSLYGLPSLKEAYGEKASDRVCELVNYDLDRFDVDDLPDLPPLPESAPQRLRFLTPGECADAPSRGYVVKGLLAPGDVGCIFGAPGAGKSLISPHLGYAVAQGRDVFGMRTKPGKVFYVAAEDPHGMRGRVSALKLRHGQADNFLVVEGVSDLLAKDSSNFLDLYRAVEEQRPAIVFIDTLAMAFPGLEENSAEAMGLVVARARKLASHGAGIVLIHHDTKQQGATPRGHSLLNGALDMGLHLFPRDESGIVRGKLTKNRNGSCDRDIAFRIATEAMGEDEDGDAITFALVDELAPGTAPKQERLSPSEKAAFGTLRRMSGTGQNVEVSEWRETCIDGRAVSSSENRDTRKRAFNRALSRLAQSGLIYVVGGKARVASSNTGTDAFDDALEQSDP